MKLHFAVVRAPKIAPSEFLTQYVNETVGRE